MIKKFVNTVNQLKNVYLYGAGVVCHRIIDLCLENDIVISGILVEDVSSNPKEILGIPVFSLREKNETFPEIDLIVSISGRVRIIPSLENSLFDYNFKSIYIPSEGFRVSLSEWDKQRKVQEISEKLLLKIDVNNIFSEPGHAIVFDENGAQALFRIESSEIFNNIEADITNQYIDFVNEIGFLDYVAHRDTCVYSKDIASVDRVAPFVATSHLDKVTSDEIVSQGFIPLQVGASLTDKRKGCQTDCEGDNISNRNLAYSECTGLYWIYKNYDMSNIDYIGYGQYRRRLVLDDNSIEYIKEKNLDVVLSLPHFCTETVKEFFLRYIPEKDWELMKEYILELDDTYGPLWEKYENGHFLFPCNLMLWKKEWFIKYCDFSFEITEKIFDYYESRNIIRQDRYMGYIFENLTTFFAIIHKDDMKIGYTEVKWIP